jgi:hypothetical protein
MEDNFKLTIEDEILIGGVNILQTDVKRHLAPFERNVD